MKGLLTIACILISSIAVSGQTIALKDSARLLGEGKISAGDFVFNTSFTRDGNTVFFSKATVNWNYIAIFYAERTVSGWSDPEPVNFTGTFRDTDPFVSADGKRLYFASDRPVGGADFKDYDYHYFYVELNGSKVVSKPVLFNLPLPDGIRINYLSFADNGNAYFHSADGKGDGDIYVCKLKNGKYLPPEPLSFNDKRYFDFDAMVAHDESFIIFSSPNRKGLGGADLWVSFKKDTSWSEPVNLGSKINTKGSDNAPGLSRDDKKLYFTSYHERAAERPIYKDGKATAAAINKLLHSTKNGLRNIYEIDISDLKPSD
ncbi:hypothetical protein [Mucilaginibacter sp. L3T2-6]|uniref:TolB family protein n=1 Tax=Mucilaginibacter sp. L3T2-6 TaxID=3062491 RepID=UPI00267703FB|nr:hypothetical protein [Mucilaginibacter sp. L3T2-6]MDO3643929.1 hypothetical protein [Mucilaginibacter sp. L3T2-6]MDV6216348.1 hypothetical protein [Mucilaginibacter sp. L3T2-6]